MNRTALYLMLILAGVIFIPKTALCDELSEVKTQMQKIQEENRSLQEQLNKQKELAERLIDKIEALENKDKSISQDIERLKVKEPSEGIFPVFKERVFGPKLDIRGFTDITFKAEDDVNAGEQNPNTFALGQLDLFITSELSDEVSFLSETVIESDDENDTTIDQERLQLKYALSELLNISIGRMHTALGFWNTEYHHSTWLHSTVFRPIIHDWEDEGGIIPNHFVGLFASGKKDLDSFDFEYDLGIANGRGKTITKIQNAQDKNDSKAFNARLQATPDFIPGLKIGVSSYMDKIPANSSSAARNGEIDELIVAGHIVYFKDNIELLTEALRLNHDDEVSHKDYDTFGFYLQGAYQFDKWKPYYRFDFVDYGDGDPYYTPNDIDISKHTLGIRWDPITWNSIKLEYSYSERDDADDRHGIAAQSAFTF